MRSTGLTLIDTLHPEQGTLMERERERERRERRDY